jgi:hypothetical protein
LPTTRVINKQVTQERSLKQSATRIKKQGASSSLRIIKIKTLLVEFSM